MKPIQTGLAALLCLTVFSPALAPADVALTPAKTLTKMDPAKFKDWRAKWEASIVQGAKKDRYCDKSMGEDIGWYMTPYTNGFYYGFMATKDPKWIAMQIDWADSWINRGIKEPDGYLGWPAPGAAGTDVDKLNGYNADSFLGEAMALRPLVLTAKEILKDLALKAKYGEKAESYIKLAERQFEKWDQRGAWRETKDGGIISVTLPYGLDPTNTKWVDFDTRNDPGHGFSHPNNKSTAVAHWMLAMYDVTEKPIYKERAEKWFKLLRSRLTLKPDGLYSIWNYWQPAGAWDYKDDKSTKHWVGVHEPHPWYYDIDVAGMVDAYEHGIVITKTDIDHLIATGLAEKRYWSALVPYSPEIQQHFEDGHKPDGWGGLSGTPWYLMLQTQLK